MAKSAKKLEAQALRRAGMSIRDIANRLEISRASASVWCNQISLTELQVSNLRTRMIAAGHKGRLMGAQKNRDKKVHIIAKYTLQGKETARTLSAREALLIGIAIYWGEGSKVGQLSFVNSDKDMILFMHRWFQTSLRIPQADFMPRVYINSIHKHRKSQIESYWSQLLNLPLEQFGSTIFIRRGTVKRYENHTDYFGLLSLRIRRSADLKYRILGLIEGLKCSTFR